MLRKTFTKIFIIATLLVFLVNTGCEFTEGEYLDLRPFAYERPVRLAVVGGYVGYVKDLNVQSEEEGGNIEVVSFDSKKTFSESKFRDTFDYALYIDKLSAKGIDLDEFSVYLCLCTLTLFPFFDYDKSEGTGTLVRLENQEELGKVKLLRKEWEVIWCATKTNTCNISIAPAQSMIMADATARPLPALKTIPTPTKIVSRGKKKSTKIGGMRKTKPSANDKPEDPIKALAEQVAELTKQGQFEDALVGQAELVKHSRETLGETNKLTAFAYLDFARLHLALGHYSEAATWLASSMGIIGASYGANSRQAAWVYLDYGRMYYEQGNYAEADKNFLQVEGIVSGQSKVGSKFMSELKTARSILQLTKGQVNASKQFAMTAVGYSGFDDTCRTALRYDAAGQALFALGDYDGAESNFDTAIEKCQNAQGAAHPLMGQYLDHKAMLYTQRGFYEKARPLFDRGLTIRANALGETHLATAQSRSDMGEFYRQVSEFTDATSQLNQAQTIFAEGVGEKHMNYALALNRKARLLIDRGDYAQAGQYARSCQGVVQENFGDGHPLYASATVTAGIVDHKLGRYPEAEANYNAALVVFNNQELPDRVEAYRMLGKLYGDWGRYADAKIALKSAEDIQSQLYGNESIELAQVITDIAKVDRDSGDLQSAEENLEKVAAIEQKVFGEESMEVADTKKELAEVNREQGDLAQAREHLEKAIEIQEKIKGENSLEVADARTELARLEMEEGKFDEAEKNLEKAAQIQETALGKAHPATLETEKEKARLLTATGRDDEAEKVYEDIVATVEQKYGDQSIATAKAKKELGDFYTETYQFEQAEKPLEESYDIVQKTLPENHPTIAAAAGKLGELYEATGDEEKAEKMYTQNAEICEKVFGENRPETMEAYRLLGMHLAARANYKDAETALAKALAVSRNRKAPDGTTHIDTAKNAEALALVFINTDRLPDASPLIEESLKIRKDFFGEQHPAYAKTLSLKGRWAMSKGDMLMAEKLFTQAHDIRAKALGTKHPATIETAVELGTVYWATGKPEKADPMFAEAFEGQKDHLLMNLEGGLVEEGLKFLALQQPYIDRQVDFYVAQKNPEAAYDRVVFVKGLQFDAALSSRDAKRMLTDPALKADYQKLREAILAQSNLFNRKLTATDPQSIQVLDDYLVGWDRNLKEMDRILAEKSNAYTRSKNALRVDAKQVQKALPARAKFLDIYAYNQFVPDKKGPGKLVGQKYVAFVLDQKQISATDFGPSAPIDETLVRLANHMEPANVMRMFTPGADTATFEAQYKQISGEMYEKAFAPVADKLTRENLVLVSLDGALARMPLEILTDPAGNYLVGAYIFGYEASGRELIRVSRQGKAGTVSTALFVGDPDYGPPNTNTAGSAAGAMLNFPRLEETAMEVKNISGALTGEKLVLIGQSANEKSVKEQSKDREMLYYSTHGYVIDRYNSADSTGKTRGGGFSSAGTVAGKPLAQVVGNPLNLCGLAFANANVQGAASAGNDDGLLTGIEVVGMDLDKAQCVILSACQTALGHEKQGQGLVGMRYAFTLSGAKTITASCWSVPSDQTKELMEAWVPLLEKSGAAAESLREAKLNEMKLVQAKLNSTHPFFWGAFTVSGRVWE